MKLGWYTARLRAMSAGEVFYRAQQAAARRRRAAVAGHGAAIRFPSTLPDLAPITVPRSVRFFDLSIPYDATQEIDWHRDYSTGVRAPRKFYGSINYRNARQVGDAKYTWELNRHQFLVPWAQHYADSGDEQDLTAIVHMLTGWIVANPRYIGINWTSSLELALRILSWGIVFDLCGEAEPLKTIRPMVARSVGEQIDYIRNTLSRYSSANNHLVGELIGLLAAGCFFPDAPGAKRHAEFARTEILKEAHRQNFADGVNREQAIYYHHYTLEYLTTAIALFERLGWEFPHQTRELVQRMMEFVAAMVSDRGEPFEIGDRDDGFVTGLNLESKTNIYASLLWTGWRLFGVDEFGARSSRITGNHKVDPRTAYWHGAAEWSGKAREDVVTADTRPRLTLFREGGYARFDVSGTRDESLAVLFKAGPFGYPKIAAHSHCDQLSVCARIGQQEVFTDAGTFCYHSDERWRQYFKGTTAHNTVRVDTREQAEYAGPFLWATHADGELQEVEKTEQGYRIAGIHSGYRRLPQPVEHSRTLWVNGSAPQLLVRDVLASSSPHNYELIWNLSPGIELQPLSVEHAEGERTITAKTWRLLVHQEPIASLTIKSEHPLAIETFYGDNTQPAGWFSRKFGERVPSVQLRVSVTAGWWSVDSSLALL